MTYILRHNDDRGMSVSEINSTANAIINAGAETTATLLFGAIYHLIQNPRVMQLLTEEIRGALAAEGEICIMTASRLKYMLTVLDESLRLYPPVPTGLPLVPEEGDVIYGKFVPAGVSTWILSKK
jgi:cytochrome P450